MIGAVAAANSITLTDPNGLGWPGAGGGLTYSVMSGEGNYDIDSVDDNTTIQLKQPWNGPTLTVLAYITFNPIWYIGDVTGEHTDGVGGIVRLTGSDNDITKTRARCILNTSKDYRVFRGFLLDMCTLQGITFATSDHLVVEDCSFILTQVGITPSTVVNMTVRRCRFATDGTAFYLNPGAPEDDTGIVIENCIQDEYEVFLHSLEVGGITIRNCGFIAINMGVRVQTALTTGQTIVVNNCIFEGCGTALRATVVGDITEDYNALFANTTDRTNVAVGANSNAYPALLQSPLLHAGADQISGFKFPWQFGEFSEWSQVRAIAGAFEAYGDLHGIPRPVTSAKKSWGASQFGEKEVESGTVQAGTYSRVLHDAMQVLVRRIPVTGVEITVTLYMRFEADYEPDPASLPRMVIKQPGQADQITTMTVAANNWEQLSDTFTPASPPGFVEVWAESRNTSAAGNYEVFYDTMGVS